MISLISTCFQSGDYVCISTTLRLRIGFVQAFLSLHNNLLPCTISHSIVTTPVLEP
jgi:hypothetical protein